MNAQQIEVLRQLGDAIRRDGPGAPNVKQLLDTIRALSPELVPVVELLLGHAAPPAPAPAPAPPAPAPALARPAPAPGPVSAPAPAPAPAPDPAAGPGIMGTSGWVALILAAAGATGVATNFTSILESAPPLDPPAWLTRCGWVMFAATLASGVVGGAISCFAMTGWKRPPLLFRQVGGETYATVGLIPNLIIGALGAWFMGWAQSCSAAPAPTDPSAEVAKGADAAKGAGAGAAEGAKPPAPFRYPQAILALVATGATGFTTARSLASHGRAQMLWAAAVQAFKLPALPGVASQVAQMTRAGDVLQMARNLGTGGGGFGTLAAVIPLFDAGRTRAAVAELRRTNRVAPIQKDGTNVSVAVLVDAGGVSEPVRKAIEPLTLDRVPADLDAFLAECQRLAGNVANDRNALVLLWAAAQKVKPLLAGIPPDIVFDESAFPAG